MRKHVNVRIPICGHAERKHYAKGMCQTCYIYAWRSTHPGRHAAINRAWEARHPIHASTIRRNAPSRLDKKKRSAEFKRYYNRHPEYFRDKRRRDRHARRASGAVTVTIEELHRAGGGVCYWARAFSPSQCIAPSRRIDLSLAGSHRYGATMEHIQSVTPPDDGPAGTNDASNLDVAHRCCNVAHSNRGPRQLQAFGADAWG